MKKRIIFATKNEGKLREIRMIMHDVDCEILSMAQAGFETEPEEDGATFEENALIKARAVAKASGEMVLADDSGLEIDYLDGAPGIYSARYLGYDTPYAEKNRIILDLLKDVPDEKRSARFVCAIAAVTPEGDTFTVRETMEGMIGHEAEGENGFGYDPIFYLLAFGCSSASISPEQKNEISHRGKALRAMKEKLKAYLSE